MANQSRNKKHGAKDPLHVPLRAFSEGNYVKLRKALNGLRKGGQLTESEQEIATHLTEATRIDPVTLYVGLACLGIFGIAVLVTSLIQP